MPPVGFEPTFSADERLQTYALDRAATGTGSDRLLEIAKGNQCVKSGLFVYVNGDAPNFLKTYHHRAPPEAASESRNQCGEDRKQDGTD